MDSAGKHDAVRRRPVLRVHQLHYFLREVAGAVDSTTHGEKVVSFAANKRTVHSASCAVEVESVACRCEHRARLVPAIHQLPHGKTWN